MISTVFKSYIAPMLRRPPRFQIAALCHRKGQDGPEVLLITSRDTHRWILPKGWPMYDTDAGGAAVQEAWEEAGVEIREGDRSRRIGRYRYDKVLEGGLPVATDVDVYAVEVRRLHDSYPEVGQRERRWVSPLAAAEMVDEDELKDLLRNLPDLL
jgi:8-oxo-dGTP pyrophosphatase MutT (NUDIX family)